MIRFVCTLVLLLAPLAGAVPGESRAETGKRPKLVVVIVIDQFRYDYLTRFREHYRRGFDRLLRNGAVFTNAYLQHFPTVTAVGHAAVLSGATPALSGIINNEWYDRKAGTPVTSVSDPATRLLGGTARSGASPHRLMVSSLGDEMKMAGRDKPRIVGMSFKDRAAILPSGHMADGAYWFEDATGHFVSSTFYFADLPAWVKEFNNSGASGKFTGARWEAAVAGTDGPAGGLFKTLPPQTGAQYFGAMAGSPYGNDLLEVFAEHAVEAEKLGARGATDLLTISFSSNDLVGHDAGPDSPEVRDISIRMDHTIGKLLEFLDARAGLGNVLVVLTADHGVAPVPEVMAARKMPGGRLSDEGAGKSVEAALSEQYGAGKWVVWAAYGTVYLNQELIRQRNLGAADVERSAAAALERMPHVSRVYTRHQLMTGQFAQDAVGLRVGNGFYPERSGDVIAVLDPYWIYAGHGTTHGSPYNYDAHVPVIFMGPGVKPGRYSRNIASYDIAPTLATMLDVDTPAGSVGRVLTEMLE